MITWIGILLLFVVASAETAFAQTKLNPSEFTLGKNTLDLAVPESPAFSALGVTPQQITRPTTVRELATSIINGVDREGNFQSGIAVDTAPYMLLVGSRITLQDYQEGHYLTRFLSHWQVSFATTKGSDEDDPSAKLALGMRFTLFDRGDPRTDKELIDCLVSEGKSVFGVSISPLAKDEEIALEMRKREELVRQGVKSCREKSTKRRWNRSAWIIGVAPTWISPDGTTSQVDHSGTAFWTSVGYGFEKIPVLEDHAMLAFYVKARNNETSPDQINPGSLITQDNLSSGVRFLIGSSRTQFNFEALWVENDREDMVEDRYWNIGFGFEQRMIDNVWLNLSLGQQYKREELGNQFVVLNSFNWGLGPR